MNFLNEYKMIRVIDLSRDYINLLRETSCPILDKYLIPDVNSIITSYLSIDYNRPWLIESLKIIHRYRDVNRRKMLLSNDILARFTCCYRQLDKTKICGYSIYYRSKYVFELKYAIKPDKSCYCTIRTNYGRQVTYYLGGKSTGEIVSTFKQYLETFENSRELAYQITLIYLVLIQLTPKEE